MNTSQKIAQEKQEKEQLLQAYVIGVAEHLRHELKVNDYSTMKMIERLNPELIADVKARFQEQDGTPLPLLILNNLYKTNDELSKRLEQTGNAYPYCYTAWGLIKLAQQVK
jgi:hypothetical protein